MLHKDFPDFVKAAWRGEQGWNEAVDGFRDRVTRWNKEVFGNMKYKKEILYRRLDGINRKLAAGAYYPEIDRLRNDLWLELEGLLAQEEVMWV